jgi:uncharacterized membrane protein YeaQ/YmgE (transglycosylase-associated protein family)
MSTDGLPPVWLIAAALPLILLLAWAFGAIARWLLRGRARLGVATSMVISILGTAIGLFIAGWIDSEVQFWSLLSLLLGLGTSIGAVAVYGAVAAHFQHPQRASVVELLAAGESDRVEFKSTARVNLHTGAKDERMEQVIAKTIGGFLNGDGGTLLIGVDDAGTPLGLAADYATLKVPDADRYELWLRDLVSTSLGQNAAAAVGIEFTPLPDVDGEPVVCRVTCLPSPRPVYLRSGKSAAPELWVRTGNSTRQLSVDEASSYVMHRWPLGLGATFAAQFRAAVRFSEER